MGTNSKEEEGRQPIIRSKFNENCRKLKKIELGVGGAKHKSFKRFFSRMLLTILFLASLLIVAEQSGSEERCCDNQECQDRGRYLFNKQLFTPNSLGTCPT